MPTTRYYLGYAGAAPAVIPAADAFWNATATSQPAVVRPLSTVRPTGNAVNASATPPGGAIRNILCGTYVSAPLPAGPVAGDFRYVAAMAGTSTGNVMWQLRVRVVDAAGVTRGVLFAGNGAATTSTDPTLANYAVATTTTISGMKSRRVAGAFTPVTAQAGDRLVVEVGARQLTPNGTNRYAGVVVTGDAAQADHGFAVDEAGGRVPWFEWITPDPPGPPTGLAQTDATPTTVAVSWAAPAGGAAPTSYEYRLDGGAPVDVGLTTSTTIAGLLPSTSHAVEVRSVGAAGASAWAGPVTATTQPPPVFRPWLVSEVLLAHAGAHPQDDQPAFQWLDEGPGGFTIDELRSRSLIGWQITTGRPGPRDRVQPPVATVTLAAWGAYAALPLPELGNRFRLALSPLLAALGIAAGDLPRFSGEVTDVVLDTRRHVVTLTAVGLSARAGRGILDGTGWPVEREGARVARILTAADPAQPLGSIDAGRVELLPPAAAAPIAQLLDAVSDSTTGQLVEQRDGTLDWHDADHRRDATALLTLDAGELLAGFTWAQRVGDLTNHVVVRYAGGEVHVEDLESTLARGSYAATLDTLLTRRAEAQAIGGLIVGRYGKPVWLLPAVLLDLTRTLDPAELGAGAALAHGHKVQLTGLPAGGPYTGAGVYVEGVTETLTARAWRLQLTVADERLAGGPIRWKDVPDGLRWLDVRDGLRWLDVATIQDPTDLD